MLPLLLSAPPVFAQNQPDFFGLGDLPGGAVASGALAVSGDGLVVAGDSESSGGTEAFRWTEAGGLVGLGTLSGGDFFSSANGVSADGSVVSGTASNSAGSTAFRFTSGAGMVGLDQLSCSPLCSAPALGSGLSPDGLVVTGSGAHKTLFGDAHADGLRWPGGGTSDSILATAPGGGTSGTGGHSQASQANDADQTGAVLVGEGESGGDVRAVVWTSSGSVAALLPAPAGAIVNSTALAISADGSTIVGAANTSDTMATSLEAALWDGPGHGTLTLLGDLGATSPRSRAYDVSSDGAIVVGTARDAAGEDRAFLWTAADGMRDLAFVLLEDYGIDVGAWALSEARGVSSPNPGGEFAVVGVGINPAGDPEGFYAFLSPTACNDGIDNDLDGDVDHPDDAECNRKSDRSEIADCADGLDNDGDGDVDDGSDAGCNDAADPSEEFDCADGLDNDGDLGADFPADPGCRGPDHPIEDPACNDGDDDDSDGQIDYPADPGCLAPDDFSEIGDCNDGIDNDFDGFVDFPADPDCDGVNDPAEDAQCNDRVDNDLDHEADYPGAYPACTSESDTSEREQCRDGEDNDGDLLVDFPAETTCLSALFPTESPVLLAADDLLVLDRHSRTLFRLDKGTGAQTPLSVSAQLTAPQGLALRATGELIVADPAGLFEVVSMTGVQRRFSGPVSAEESLQVVIDAAGDAVVLGTDELLSVAWTAGGSNAPATLTAFPVDAVLTYFRGDALAREADGRLLVAAFGFLGEGVFRILDPLALPPTYEMVSPILATDRFTDLTIEADGTILGVGQRITPGETGVFRVVPSGPSMGATTALSTDPAWTSPVAVAVSAANGDVFVADEGVCADGVCAGASVVRVDPVSGARLDVFGGGYITGPMDLLLVSALPACQDGVDNGDGDGLVDLFDPECNHPWDPSEEPDCSDGLDNDGDGLFDHPADPGCWVATGLVENPQCNDGLDNDFDGLVDYPADPNCGSAAGVREKKKSGCGLTGGEAVLLLALLRRGRSLTC